MLAGLTFDQGRCRKYRETPVNRWSSMTSEEFYTVLTGAFRSLRLFRAIFLRFWINDLVRYRRLCRVVVTCVSSVWSRCSPVYLLHASRVLDWWRSTVPATSEPIEASRWTSGTSPRERSAESVTMAEADDNSGSDKYLRTKGDCKKRKISSSEYVLRKRRPKVDKSDGNIYVNNKTPFKVCTSLLERFL